MTPPAPVGRTAFLLGFAGLLPQVAAVLLLALGSTDTLIDAGVAGGVAFVAELYGAVILSFLGGMWWGIAMRREAGQGSLVALAVLPSLVAFGIPVLGTATWPTSVELIALGIAVLLTLSVDRHLVRTGEAPANWMRLRVPLSVGLGGLTILAGLLSR